MPRSGERPGWVQFLAGRLLAGASTLAVLSVLIFTATAVLPGDASGSLAGPDASAAERAAIRAELGLDRPAAERYLDWAAGVLRGDLGTAWVGGRPVAELLADRLPVSALPAGLALVVIVPLASGLGLLAGMRAGRGADRAVSAGALVTAAVPEFLTASLLVAVFAGWLRWLPRGSMVPLGESPLADPQILVLPVACLCLVGLATATRLVRASAAEVAATPYVESARLNGVRGLRLAFAHVLPNAAGPAVQVVAVVVGALVGGAVVVETLLGYPGVGLELAQAVARRDVPVVQGLTLALAAVALAALLLGDVVRRLLDPTGRYR
ncbi:ABC transporter permease [Pseudonocardia sp. NPDC049635]|uniref:ABC transporter permease n=1 Tax=Pseudonocardia sp. NPDC049635 TaxID=3155506 RepID=UPI0033C680FC